MTIHRGRPREVRARTIDTRETKRHLRVVRPLPAELDHWRPQTRGDCIGGPRPCPYVGCTHNLYLDVVGVNGSIKLNFPDLEPEDMHPAASCSLDLAAAGPLELHAVGQVMNVTRERVRQLEALGLRKLRVRGCDLAGQHFEEQAGPFEPEET